MDLDQQIQALVDQSPQDGVMPQTVQAIAPILKAFAERLQHLEYFVLQNLSQQWVVTTVEKPSQPEDKRSLVYAFASLQDASAGPNSLQDPQLMALPLPVTHILFQLLSMKPVDSLIFFETPGDRAQGLEVRRQDLETAIQLQLQHLRDQPQVPPDLA